MIGEQWSDPQQLRFPQVPFEISPMVLKVRRFSPDEDVAPQVPESEHLQVCEFLSAKKTHCDRGELGVTRDGKRPGLVAIHTPLMRGPAKRMRASADLERQIEQSRHRCDRGDKFPEIP